MSAVPVNCATLGESDLRTILTEVLYEFPIQQIAVALPRFVSILSANHPVQSSVYDSLRQAGSAAHTMRDLQAMAQALCENEWIDDARIANMDLGTGCARLVADVPNRVFYQIVTEQTGIQMKDEADLIPVLTRLSATAKEYERIAGALEQAQATGYGVVMPRLEDLSLAPPEIISSRWPVRSQTLRFRCLHPSHESRNQGIGYSYRWHRKTVRGAAQLPAWRIRRRSRKNLGYQYFW